MNLVVLKGNLSRDIELKHYSWGSVANTAIAVNRKYTDKNGNKMQEVSFIELSLFGRIAEIAANFLHKGSPLLVQEHTILDNEMQTNIKNLIRRLQCN